MFNDAERTLNRVLDEFGAMDESIERKLARADGDEALASQTDDVASASGFDLAHFTIEDDDDDDEELIGDYDSITTAEDDNLLQGSLEEGEATTPTTENDFALAARTSQIISSYRDYLTEMEDVSAKNEQLTNEMDSLRGSLGMPKASRGSRRDRAREQCDILEEARSTKRRHYSQPLLHSRQLRRRVLGAVVGAAALTATVLAFYSAATASDGKTQSNLDWNKDLADALEEEAEETLMQDAASRARAPKARAPTADVKVAPTYSSAMKMIKEIIEHPDEVVVHAAAKTSKVDAGVESKSGKGDSSSDEHPAASSKSDKDAFSLKIKSTSKSKSSKAFSKSTSTSASKSEKKQSSNSGSSSKVGKESSSSKAGKSSSSSDGSTPTVPATLEKETRSATMHLKAASLLYEAVAREHNPIFFDRSSGWEGSTFREAAYFCANSYPKDMHGRPGVPCPYEAYCPEGPGTIPFGGYRSGTAYTPIVDTAEHWLGWVQLSEGHPCSAYNHLSSEPSPESMETLMCCMDATHSR